MMELETSFRQSGSSSAKKGASKCHPRREVRGFRGCRRYRNTFVYFLSAHVSLSNSVSLLSVVCIWKR